MREAQQELGEDTVEIVLKLPDGREISHTYLVGQSVGYVKATIQQEYGHLVKNTALLLNGTPLMDPMCLNDYPQINPREGAVFEVKVSA
eukprot:CAMPEP_0196571916 /NCGR_PEP_ID=MMETSP1081-20130531/2058_1 /TAXON_ID=36882 /ORGANISM="Pyramimonas amylifera, Strain CCMP720" /LENGTH=88 /DNA_ID=CAMNT_0041889057 /DNA_START=298 /DNA_END=564 /DNA_ORIENTATION=-